MKYQSDGDEVWMFGAHLLAVGLAVVVFVVRVVVLVAVWLVQSLWRWLWRRGEPRDVFSESDGHQKKEMNHAAE